MFITDEMSGENWFTSSAQMAIPMSRANVLWWRVWFWLALNMLFTLSGLVFMVMQSCSDQPLVGDPPVAAFLLDTTRVLHRGGRAFCNFSTLVKQDKNIGILHFRSRPHLSISISISIINLPLLLQPFNLLCFSCSLYPQITNY